jgi:hypothetical protein
MYSADSGEVLRPQINMSTGALLYAAGLCGLVCMIAALGADWFVLGTDGNLSVCSAATV